MFKKIFIITLACVVLSLGCKDKDNTDYTPLMKAVIGGNVSRVKSLLEQGADINAQNKNGQTALILASYYKYNNSEEILSLLLSSNPTVDLQDNSGRTALSWAAGAGKMVAIRHLLSANANINLQDSSGRTALSWAAGAGKMEAIRHLLSANANINLQDSDGATPLMWANLMGQKDAFLYLLENGADVNIKDKNGYTIFMKNITDVRIEQSLANLELDVSSIKEKQLSSLHWAAIWQNQDLVLSLANQGINVNIKDHIGATPLLRAASNASYKSIQTLLHLGADIHATDNNGYNALFWAIIEVDSPKTIKVLLENGININSRDKNQKTPLMWAVEKNLKKSVRYLLGEGADPNLVDKDGNSALHLAIESENIEVLKILLESGSDSTIKKSNLYIQPTNILTLLNLAQKHKLKGKKVNLEIQNKEGVSPLILALWTENILIIKYLIEFGTNINKKLNEVGITPLHEAVSIGAKPEVIKLLISKGANINAYTTRNKRTPLMFAAAYGEKEIAEILLQSGASANQINDTGETAVFFASTLKFQQELAKDLSEDESDELLKSALEKQVETLKVLINAGADVNAKTKEDETPLLWAASLPGQAKIVELLLNAGADISHKNNNGKNALDLALKTEDLEMINLLKKRFEEQTL